MLEELTRDLHKYHKIHGHYPKNWIELHAKPNCLGGGKPSFPNEAESEIWKPSTCAYTYIISSDGKEKFKISQYDTNGNLIKFTDEKTVSIDYWEQMLERSSAKPKHNGPHP